MEADTKSADKPAFAIISIQDKQGSTIQKGKKKYGTVIATNIV